METKTNYRLRVILLSFVLLSTLAVYLPTLRYQFVFDDPDQIVKNQAVHSASSIPHYFTSDVSPHASSDEVGNFYRPVFLLWLLANYKIGGLNPVWWHGTSLAMHLLATLLVYLLAFRMTRDEFLAGGSALLFGLHPVHIEGVAWISGVTEPLLAVFFLASFLCFIKSREPAHEGKSRRRGWLIASLGLFILALLEKETAIVLPVLIFFYVWIFESSGAGETGSKLSKASVALADARASDTHPQESKATGLFKPIASALPYFGLTAVYLVARFLALKGLGHAITPLSLKTLILTWPSVLLFYFRLLVWPVGLSAFYDTPYITSLSVRDFILPAVAIAIIVTALYFWSRRSRLVAFFCIWMLLPILPLFNLSVFKDGEIAHDRYLYLPSVGFCILIAFAVRHFGFGSTRIHGLRVTQLIILVGLACLLGIATWYQQAIWASDLSLSARGVAIAPRNVMAANNLGKELALRGDYDAAIPLFRQVLERRPKYWLANFNLGYVYYRVGNIPEAERYLRKAIEIDANEAAEQRFLGYTLLETGRVDEAETVLRRAIALQQDAPNQHYVLGTILKQKGDLDGARREFRLELTFNPKHAEARQEAAALEVAKQPKRSSP
jgi:Flp pilus assembly protein TadD